MIGNMKYFTCHDLRHLLSFHVIFSTILFLFFQIHSINATTKKVQINIGALEYPPFGEFNNGEATGFAFDVIRSAFNTQGYKVNFIEYPFARLIKNGPNEDIDAFQMDLDFFPKALRKNVYAPSPYFFAFMSVFSKKSEISELPKFETAGNFYQGKSIVTINSASLGSALKKFKDIGLKVEHTNDLIGGMRMLNTNRVQLLYAAEPSVLFWMKTQGYQLEDLNITRIRKSNAHLLFNKRREGYKKLSDAFMQGMININTQSSAKKGGESLMFELVSQYFGDSPTVKRFWPKQFKKTEWKEN